MGLKSGLMDFAYRMFILVFAFGLIGGFVYVFEDIEIGSILLMVGMVGLVIYIWDLKTHKLWRLTHGQ